MVTARKEAAKTMARVDLVIEVLDARLPGASSNPMITDLRNFRQRPALKVLNKADLADPVVTAAWLRALNAQVATAAIAISSKRAGDVAKIQAHASKLVPHRDSTMKPVRAMVMGIPNVGKSTLINALLGRRIAVVGDQPGITRNQQRVDVNSRFEITDTPGLMWPAIVHAADAMMLAASHALGTNAYLDDEVAEHLAGILLKRYRQSLERRYGFAADALRAMDGPAVIEAIAARRGYRVRGGAPDLERAARTLLDDYRSGVLGRISLETPEGRAAATAVAPAPPPVPDDDDEPA